MGQQYSQAQLDKMARMKGFKDYATFAAWNKKYRMKRGTGGADKQVKKEYSNVFERIAIHPAGMFKRIGDAINKATGQ